MAQRAQEHFPNRRRGLLRMGADSYHARSYALSVVVQDIGAINIDQIMNNVESLVNSNDAITIDKIVFLLQLPNFG